MVGLIHTYEKTIILYYCISLLRRSVFQRLYKFLSFQMKNIILTLMNLLHIGHMRIGNHTYITDHDIIKLKDDEYPPELR